MTSAADTVQLVIQNYFSLTLLAFPNKTNELLPPGGTFFCLNSAKALPLYISVLNYLCSL